MLGGLRDKLVDQNEKVSKDMPIDRQMLELNSSTTTMLARL